MKKILSVLVTLVLVVGLGVGAYFLFRKPQEETSVMTMSVNPEVQFILDQNNKVMNVTAVNEDGSSLISVVNFKGLTADEASKLFVEVSTQMGKINFDTTGKEVTIYIACSDELKDSQTIKQLKQNVQESVNKYFKESGIIAGAKVVSEDVSDALKKFGSQIQEFTGSTYEEAMDYIKEVNHEFENVSFEARQGLEKTINALKDAANVTISGLKSQIESLQKQITAWKEELNSSELIPDSLKKTLNEQISKAKKELKEVQTKLDTKLKELQAKIDEAIKKVQEECKAVLETLKQEVNNAIETGKAKLEEYKKAFQDKTEEQKQAIIAAIKAYQDSLNKA